MQIIGSDLSRVGGYYNAIHDAIRIGSNCLQLYSIAPQRLTFAIDKLTEDNYTDLTQAKTFLIKRKSSSKIHYKAVFSVTRENNTFMTILLIRISKK